jgi:hypothetical protein
MFEINKICMKDVFVTSTLKSEWNRVFNPALCSALEGVGVSVHLPQRDTEQTGTELDKFHQNIDGINDSRRVIAVGLNESINWGLEVGYSYGSGKQIILLTTSDHVIPTMSLGMYWEIIRVDNLDELDTYLEELKELCLSE